MGGAAYRIPRKEEIFVVLLVIPRYLAYPRSTIGALVLVDGDERADDVVRDQTWRKAERRERDFMIGVEQQTWFERDGYFARGLVAASYTYLTSPSS